MPDDKPEIPFKAEVSAKLEVKTEIPPDASGRAVHELLNAISPFTEGMGIVGAHLRVHREKVLIKIAKITRERPAIEGKVAIPVPPKFMVPFLEKASCEDIESELIDRWASLLAEASTNYDSSLLAFIDILAQLGYREIELLKDLLSGVDVGTSLESSPQFAEIFITRVAHRLLDPLFDVEDLIWDVGQKNVELQMLEDTDFIPIRVISVRLSDHLGNSGAHNMHSRWASEHLLALEILESHSLLRRHFREFSGSDRSVELDYISATALGAKLYHICENQSTDVQEDSHSKPGLRS